MRRLWHNLTTTFVHVAPVTDRWLVIRLNIWQALTFDAGLYGWRVALYNFRRTLAG